MRDELRSEISVEKSHERCTRKARQAWEMAGLARMDGDSADEKRYTEEARAWDERAKEL